MSGNYDLDQLMGTYADWVAWLKEKEASLEKQLAKLKGQSKDVQDAGAGVEEAQAALEQVLRLGDRVVLGRAARSRGRASTTSTARRLRSSGPSRGPG